MGGEKPFVKGKININQKANFGKSLGSMVNIL